VNVILRPDVHVLASQARMLSRDGRCKTFDSGADGFGRAEGCVLLVLKRLQDAVAAGDRVMAVIAGSAVNHGGASGGFSVPNPKAQTAVIAKALRAAGVDSAEVAFVETHGTGTSLGDPIEVRALADALQARTPGRSAVWLGAVKSNLGHAESAAGAVSLLKAALAVSHGVVPPNLHCHAPNPAVEWDELPFRLPARVSQWPAGYTRRAAGVSSFGMSGTNAHVVVTAGREGGRAPLPRTPFNRQRHWVDAPKREVAVEHIYRPVWSPVELPPASPCEGWLRLGPEWSTLPEGKWPGALVTLRGMGDGDPSGAAEETMRRLLASARWMDRGGASFPVWFASSSPNAVASGFVRTLAIENAHRTIGYCEYDDSAVLARVVGQSANRDVRVRDGRSYAMRLTDEPLRYREFAPRPDRTYVITGGLGDIGAMCARILVDRGARHVVLTGKRPLNPERENRLKALAPAVYFQSDVASAEETAALFTQLRAEFPRVAGIIHSAMLLSDHPASLLSEDDARAVLAPKIAGTWNLHRETLGDSLDLFVMLSSVSGVLGNAGQCAYAAGNAFQDAFAHTRRDAGLPATAIDLGPVEDTVAIRRIASRRFASSVRSLSATQTARGIEAILAADGAQYVLCALERSATQQGAATLAGADPSDYPRLLREIAAAVLDQPPESLEPDRPLQEYGLDSLLSLELRNRLAAGSEVDLPASLLFDYPTLDALASYLSERFTPAANDDEEALLDQLASKVLKAEGLG
jgi:NAD(P)-dependent dehydrogenase (short-subunit alcohol dehydrogenase family)